MNFLFPFIGAVLNATHNTLDKVALSIRGINYKSLNAIGFPLSFLGALILFLIVRPPLSLGLFAGNVWWLLLIWTATSVATNIIFYRALSEDDLIEVQTGGLFKDLVIILVASMVFVDERNIGIIIPAVIAACAVVLSRWENRKFTVKKFTLIYVAYSLISAPIVATIAKILLQTWDPISLQMVRWGITGIIFFSLFFKAAKEVPRVAYPLLIFTNFISVIGWALYYYSYQLSGIVYTVLLFSLQPFLVYLMSAFLLKEKFQPKKALAFGVVVLAIVTAQVLR